MQKNPAPQNNLLCVGLIGPRHLFRPIWRDLHMTVEHCHPGRVMWRWPTVSWC